MTIGEKISLLRKTHNLSMESLSEKVGVSRITLYNWEKDINNPSLRNIIKLSVIFDLPLEVLLDERISFNKGIYIKNST